MSVVDHLENHVYRLIEEHRLDDNQAEELFVRFADALPTYTLTPKGQEYLDKVGGGTD